MANVLWMSSRANILNQAEAVMRLEYALALGIQSTPVASLWKGALTRSIQTTVAVCDTLFVGLADREGIPMATFDGPVLRAFPGEARRPQDLVPRSG